MTKHAGPGARWLALEDRWLGPLAVREAKIMGTWRPGVRYLPSPSLRWTARGLAVLFVILLISFAIPIAWRRALYLTLFFGVFLGGLWAASRDLR
jgi:hypothetical protein